MDQGNTLKLSLYLMIMLVVVPRELQANSFKFQDVCGDTKATFSISHSDQVVAKIPEGEFTTVFMNYAEEYVFECKSNTPSTTSNHAQPEIKFNSSDTLNKQSNRIKGSGLDTGTSRRNLTTNLMENPRVNQYNKQNQTVSCTIDNKVICNINVIVITEKGADKCVIPSRNQSMKDSSPIIETAAKRITDVSKLDCKLRTELFMYTPKHSPTESEIRRYSVWNDKEWVPCDRLVENSTLFNVKYNTIDNVQDIRCPFKINPDPKVTKPYMIQVATEYKSKYGAALPMFAPPSEVNYSYFSVSLSDTVNLEQQRVDVTENDSAKYPVVVPIVTSFITVIIVFVVIIVILRFKCFNHTVGTFCLKDDVENKGDEETDEYRYVIKYGKEDGVKRYNDYMKSNYSGYSKYSDTSSMMTDQTSVSYVDACGRRRLISEIQGLDEANLDLKGEDKVQFRKNILARQLSGDPTKLNPNITLNEQAKIMVYNPKLEIDRSNFSYGKMLGSGNFGCVYEGEALGLFHPDSNTKVAVKTVNDPFDGAQRTAILCEMKILSNLELHLNLVNMMGSCTSDFAVSGELWLLLEFCQYGDMKSFLIKNEAAFLGGTNEFSDVTDLDSRLLIQWAYNIAKGMRYLSRKHIMHGDLAARNILIGRGQGRNGLSKLVAKVSDFGLSKTFYDNIRYKKQKRQYVPWKWMAIEYLQTGHLTITSDVWSYGIVLWELFSLGKEPYVGKNVEDMIAKLKDGYHLPCPEEVNQVSTWSPIDIYNKVTDGCFVSEPMKRATFSDIVQILEAGLYKEEKEEYKELTEQYESMRELMEDPITQLKRASTFTRNSLQQLNILSEDGKPQKQSPLHGESKGKKADPSYMKAVAANDPPIPGQVKNNCDISSDKKVENSKENIGDTIEYVAFQTNSDLSGDEVSQENNDSGGYVAFEEIATVHKNNEDQEFLPDNQTNNANNSTECIPERENLCAAYVTIEHCLETVNI